MTYRPEPSPQPQPCLPDAPLFRHHSANLGLTDFPPAADRSRVERASTGQCKVRDTAPAMAPDAVATRDDDFAPTTGNPGGLPTHLALGHDQAMHIYVRRGVVLHVQRGSVLLTPPPRWLAETAWAPQVTLAAGRAHVVPRTGWMVLQAATPAEIACHDVADAPSRWPWLLAVVRMAKRLRGRSTTAAAPAWQRETGAAQRRPSH